MKTDELLGESCAEVLASAGMAAHGAIRSAKVVGVTADGSPLVDFPGNPFGPVPARSTVTILREMLDVERDALVVFADGDPQKPVIVGLIQADPVTPVPDIGKLAPRSPIEVSADGRRLSLTAYSELHLRCGQSSITLRRDGKLVIDGAYVLSRARVTNRIKGGSVQIN